MTQYPFTWTDGEGKAHDVLPDWDVDQWTGREVRDLERVGLLGAGGGRTTTAMAVFSVAVARQVPGYTIASAFDEMTLGQVQAALKETRERASAEAKTDPAPEPTGRVVEFTGEAVLVPAVAEGAEVLSPTSDASEGSSEQA